MMPSLISLLSSLFSLLSRALSFLPLFSLLFSLSLSLLLLGFFLSAVEFFQFQRPTLGMGNITSLNEQEKNTDKSRKEFFFFAGSISQSRREPALLAIGLFAFEARTQRAKRIKTASKRESFDRPSPSRGEHKTRSFALSPPCDGRLRKGEEEKRRES